MAEWTTDTGEHLKNVHAPEHCQGPCPIHKPSDHHMVPWLTHWNNQEKRIERMCPKHGNMHPDPDSMAFGLKLGVDPEDFLHDCCGCCTAPLLCVNCDAPCGQDDYLCVRCRS